MKPKKILTKQTEEQRFSETPTGNPAKQLRQSTSLRYPPLKNGIPVRDITAETLKTGFSLAGTIPMKQRLKEEREAEERKLKEQAEQQEDG